MTDDDMSNDPKIMVPCDGGALVPVTPWARRQAVLNMRRDPKKLAEMIARFGEERLRRDFPEVWQEGEDV
jgi:hypothetical protein